MILPLILQAAIAAAPPAGEIEGTATLGCRLTPEGALADCQVVDENPPGQGFGEAALRLAPSMKMKDPQAAAQVRVPFRFKLPADGAGDAERGAAATKTAQDTASGAPSICSRAGRDLFFQILRVKPGSLQVLGDSVTRGEPFARLSVEHTGFFELTEAVESDNPYYFLLPAGALLYRTSFGSSQPVPVAKAVGMAMFGVMPPEPKMEAWCGPGRTGSAKRLRPERTGMCLVKRASGWFLHDADFDSRNPWYVRTIRYMETGGGLHGKLEKAPVIAPTSRRADAPLSLELVYRGADTRRGRLRFEARVSGDGGSTFADTFRVQLDSSGAFGFTPCEGKLRLTPSKDGRTLAVQGP